MVAAGTSVTSNVRLVRPLGEGGMGSVWVAEHLGLDTKVAVKFISHELIDTDPTLVPRFRREAAAAAKIKSPHVVQMLDYGVMGDGIPFLIMELLEGESLADRLDRIRILDWDATCEILGQAAKALDHAHSLGIVHRDIKPENIFIQRAHEDEVVKVLDFGVAKQLKLNQDAPPTITGALLGTPAYMSPEQMVSAKNVDKKTDLWALAVLAYEMLTGCLPFQADTLGALIVEVTNVRYLPPSEHGLGSQLDGWFARAFTQVPEDRFDSARQMITALERCAASSRQPTVRQATPHLADLKGPSSGSEVTKIRRPPVGDRSIPEAAPSGTTDSLAMAPTAPGATDGDVPMETPARAETAEHTAPPTARIGPSTVNISDADVRANTTLSLADPSQGNSAGPAAAAAETPHPSATDHRLERPRTFGGAAAPVPSTGHGTPPPTSWIIAGSALLLITAVVGSLWYLSQGSETVATLRPAAIPAPRIGSAPTSNTGSQVPDGMVLVPGGTYPIGCPEDSDDLCFEDEKPAHEVTVDAFAILRTEVTVSAYNGCVKEGSCPEPGGREGCTGEKGTNEHLPVNCVSWRAAQTYCAFEGWSLPSEQQWEVAARGPDSPHYPWGDQAPSCERGLFSGCADPELQPVGSRDVDRSWIGALDMGGSLREWTSSDYAPYPGGTVAEGAEGTEGGKVNRGGSWMMKGSEANTSHTRVVDEPTERRPDLGFRCVTEVAP